MNYYFEYKSSIGDIIILSDGISITWLGISGQKYAADVLQDSVFDSSLQIFADATKWLDLYFSGIEPSFVLSLAPQGTSFRQAVWAILSEIPYGKVITYGEIAKQIASKQGKARMSAQAVGGAVGHNPISIMIPCHRVVGAGGNLTGFASGIEAKIKLLELEHIDICTFYIPKKYSL